MISRHFPKSYQDGKKGVNIISNFATLSENMYRALSYIKQDYKDFFNNKSYFPIEELITMFDETYNEFSSLVAGDDFYKTKRSSRNELIWQRIGRFDLHKVNSNVYETKIINGEIHKEINPKIYFKLQRLANVIFRIEDIASPIIKEIWSKEVVKFDPTKPQKDYKLLVKSIFDWRKENIIVNGKNEKSNFDPNKLEKRIGTSCSLISPRKLSTFNSSKTDVGIIYNLNDAFISAGPDDVFLAEQIDETGALFEDEQFEDCPMFRVHTEEKNNVYTYGSTKISTPSEILESGNNTTYYNEVVLDSRVAEPVAVYLFTFDGQPRYSQEKRAIEMSQAFNLPIVAIEKNQKNMGVRPFEAQELSL